MIPESEKEGGRKEGTQNYKRCYSHISNFYAIYNIYFIAFSVA